MGDETKTLSVEELKIKGNECVKEEKFIEAVLHYTHAIKMDPTNYVLYSNRSFAFLKLDQHFLSLQDANETIKLQPQWAKGYFRRAEVETASGLYDEAFISYTKALQLDPHNHKIIESIKNVTETQKKKMEKHKNTIWICTCIGLIVGIVVVILDYTMTSSPTLTNPISMVAFAIALSGIGFAIGKTATLMSAWSDGKSILPPADLAASSANEEESVMPERKAKYSKAQARQSIPNDPVLRSKLIAIIIKSREEDVSQPAKTTVICSDHFHAKDLYFVNNQKRRR